MVHIAGEFQCLEGFYSFSSVAWAVQDFCHIRPTQFAKTYQRNIWYFAPDLSYLNFMWAAEVVATLQDSPFSSATSGSLLASSSPKNYWSHWKSSGLTCFHSTSLLGDSIYFSLLVTALMLVQGVSKVRALLNQTHSMESNSLGNLLLSLQNSPVSLEESWAETFPQDFSFAPHCREPFTLAHREMYPFGGNSFNNCQTFLTAL